MGKPKGIGFNRIIKGHWLDQAAAFAASGNDEASARALLNEYLAAEIKGAESRDRTLDLLTRTWFKSSERDRELRDQALSLFGDVETSTDRVWLHWGMLLLAYPFFRDATNVIGKAGRMGTSFDRAMIADRITEQKGEVASLYVGVGRVISLLKDWQMIESNGTKNRYRSSSSTLHTSLVPLQIWLMAASLKSNSASALPLSDLGYQPELFPFGFTVSSRELRISPWFEIHRQAGGLDMVSLADWTLV